MIARPVAQRIDQALMDAACELDGADQLHQALLELVDAPAGVLARRTAAVLYAAYLYESDDYLQRLLTEVAQREGNWQDLSHVEDHDAPCRLPDGVCDDCREITERALEAAVFELRHHLRESALADLAAVAA